MKALIIYNPTSGREQFKKNIDRVVKKLSDADIFCDVYATKAPLDATKVAKEKGELYELVIVSGGDGTLNEVVNGVSRCTNKPTIGYIPTGTVNDVATTLRIPKHIDRAVDNIIEGTTVEMDIGQINDHYFTYVAAFGTYTKVSYTAPSDTKTKFGKSAYVYEFLKDITQVQEIPLEMTYDGKRLYGVFSMGMFINSHTIGGFPIIDKPKLNDGKFDVVLFEREPQKDLINIVRTFLLSTRNKPRNSIHLKAHEIEIKVHENVKWNVDGEFAAKGSIHLICHQEFLKFIVPEKTKKRLFKKKK